MSREDFLDPDNNWNCIKCGACCKNVTPIYPELDRGDRTCKHLGKDELCQIYDERPPLCRIPKVLIKTYPNILADACDELRKIFNASPKDRRSN